MSDITHPQLVQLLVGIARAQTALIDAIDNTSPGFKMTHMSPALQTAARMRDPNHQATLTDFPLRLLYQMQSAARPGQQPVDAWALKELERLLTPAQS